MKQSERQEEFLKLLEPVYPKLSRYSLAVTRNVAEAEDLTSDTVLIALEQFDKIDNKDHFAGFLFKVASRLHKRRRHRERFRISYDQKTVEAKEDITPMPDQAAEIAIVMVALDKLPLKIRETVVLFDVTDLSLEEIRNIQGGSLSGVKSRLKRGREMVQKYLGITDASKIKTIEIRHSYFDPSLRKKGEYYAL